MNVLTKISIVAIILIMFMGCRNSVEQPHPCNLPTDKDIDVVKIEITATKQSSEGMYGIVSEIGFAKYGNDILEFEFPAIISDEYLGEYFWYNSENIIPEGVTISDPQAKVGLFEISAYNKAKEYIGYFVFCYDVQNGWYAEHIYTDRSFTIKGISKRGCVFDCSFEKGWNIRYYTPLNKGKYTTQKPSNEELKWRYEEIKCM